MATQDPPRENRTGEGDKKGRKPKWHGASQHFFYWQVLDPVTSHSHRSCSAGIALPTQRHGGEEREKEDTSLPQPHIKELMKGE